MDQAVVAVLLVATILKIVDFIRQLRNGDSNGMVTQLVAWVVGALVVMGTALTSLGDVAVGGQSLDSGWLAQALMGVGLGSGALVLKDIIKALGLNQSAEEPLVEE